MKKIGLEEHFLIPELAGYIEETYQNINKGLAEKAVPGLLDIDGFLCWNIRVSSLL